MNLKISATDIAIIRHECKKIAKCHSRSNRFQILIGERYNIDGFYPDINSINVWSISNDPTDDWEDTDLYDTIDFDTLKKPLAMTDDGRAIVDFYIYEWDGTFKCWGELACNAQAEFDMDGLKAMHADGDKNKWTRT